MYIDKPYLTYNAGLTKEDIKEAVREVLQQSERKQKGFSSVGSAEAESLLELLKIVEVDGNCLDPIKTPGNCQACETFRYEDYHDEDAGSVQLMNHHQLHLQKMGVPFGRNGYQMYDLRSLQAPYVITTSTTQYRGNMDACVAPYGISLSSAARQVRVGYEHKQSPKQKQIYKDNHSHELLPEVHWTCLPGFPKSLDPLWMLLQTATWDAGG